ncbi:MAG: galactosyldiacylglycerol synthase [Acidobacteria bacterium]|nr:MAG: galactosyldiacylglycerol synthase [Acidobacteriota bacterium]PYV76657.1 MAG: galactosyldiacylglycerol synthase [Acidobacteriota bacterium]
MERKLTIVFFDAGGGHRSAAEALKSVLENQEQPWRVELLNLQEQLDKLDIVRKLTGIRLQDAYNLILRKGWTRLTPQLLPAMQSVIRMFHRPTVKMLQDYWRQNPTDLVLSVIPHFNRAMAESIRKTTPRTAFVTLLTDFADYPPHFWIERQKQFLICGSERAEQQAFALGHDRDHVFLASGMIMKPKFYQRTSVDRKSERGRLGLDSDIPVGIVLFGGHGSGTMLHIVKRINAVSIKVQLILICGKNTKLQNAIKSLKTRFPIFVEGFTQNVDHYMALSDFFIGKPGPGSISEALQFHLPVIVECNSRTLPQERYNAQWVTEKRVGIVLKSFRHVTEGVQQLLDPTTFAEFRKNAEAYTNRALFEIPQFLDTIAYRQSSIQNTETVLQIAEEA